ncbi:MAG: hypothetical protein F7B20_01030 [Aeropyrum sp.]|nr:hypothetical protein [Aeropyrum sp.]MCE4616545.1 hypothetical protein [Aeropyrum sp.]
MKVLSVFCRILERLLERLDPIGQIYARLVEPAMGYPRDREVLSQLRASGLGLDCARACESLYWLENRVRGKRVCIIGPEMLKPGKPPYCDALAGPESAVLWARASGLVLDYVTGDGDLDPLMYSVALVFTRVFFKHLHGDNWWSSPPGPQHHQDRTIIYTTQVWPHTNCILGPLGFTDGDRAAILATAMKAKEVHLLGFSREPVATHKSAPTGFSSTKRAKLELAFKMIREASRSMGYHFSTSYIYPRSYVLEEA